MSISLPVFLSVCWSPCLSVCLSVCWCSSLPACLFVSLPPCLPVSVCLSVSLPVSLSVRWEQFDKKYLSKLLLRKSVYRKSELWEAYQKINIRDAISVIDQVWGGRGMFNVYLFRVILVII